MNDVGEVARHTVLGVLRANKVEVGKTDDPAIYVLAKGEIIEAQKLPDHISKTMLHYLSRRFDVPIYAFYNPGMPIPVLKIESRRT